MCSFQVHCIKLRGSWKQFSEFSGFLNWQLRTACTCEQGSKCVCWSIFVGPVIDWWPDQATNSFIEKLDGKEGKLTVRWSIFGQRGWQLSYQDYRKPSGELDATKELFTSLTVFVVSSHFCFLSVIIPQSSDFWRRYSSSECITCACVDVVTLATESQQSVACQNPNITSSYHALALREPLLELSNCPPGHRLPCWVRFCWSKQICEHRAYFSQHAQCCG